MDPVHEMQLYIERRDIRIQDMQLCINNGNEQRRRAVADMKMCNLRTQSARVDRPSWWG